MSVLSLFIGSVVQSKIPHVKFALAYHIFTLRNEQDHILYRVCFKVTGYISMKNTD